MFDAPVCIDRYRAGLRTEFRDQVRTILPLLNGRDFFLLTLISEHTLF